VTIPLPEVNTKFPNAIRAMVLIPVTWLMTGVLIYAAVWAASSREVLTIVVWCIVALNFAVFVFKLRLGAETSTAYRVLVSAVLACISPGAATALMLVVAVLFFGMEVPRV